ncbi:MAG: DUF1761 domain-containing protein [Pseudorhodoplanes sp.]|nr:DUF1761 domain-containing protein [Pseudorhodoplanes sp.]
MAFAGVNYQAVVIAGTAAWVAGAVYYGIFGKPWLAALGRTREDIAHARGTPAFYLPFVLAMIANLIMAGVLAGIVGHLGPGRVTLLNGIISAVFVWLGFVVTTMAVNNAFGGRKAMLTVIDSGHWLAALVVAGAVIGFVGV